MCLGIPAKIVERVDPSLGVVRADLGGVRRDVSVQLLEADGRTPEVGDWVLVHVGFAMALIDEEEAEELLRRLTEIGRADRDEPAYRDEPAGTDPA